jgi:CheY-like chemotaxis protein
VVDDLPVSLSALSDTLSVLGLQVQALDDPGGPAPGAGRGRRGRAFDLLVLDWQMPALDGPATLRAMRAAGRHHPGPAGDGLQRGRPAPAGRAAGFAQVLVKPITPRT